MSIGLYTEILTHIAHLLLCHVPCCPERLQAHTYHPCGNISNNQWARRDKGRPCGHESWSFWSSVWLPPALSPSSPKIREMIRCSVWESSVPSVLFMLTLQPEAVVTYHQHEMLLLGSFHAPIPAKSIYTQSQGCDTMSEAVVSLAVVWNQCPFLGRPDLLPLLTPFMIVCKCMWAVCVCIHDNRSRIHKRSFQSGAMHLRAKVRVCKCVYLLLCIMLTDSEDPLHTHTHTRYVLYCFLVKSDTCTKALFFPWHSSYQHRAYRSIRRAEWRWYLLYLFMKLLSRHRTQGGGCSGWMLTRAKMLSVQSNAYPQCE